MLAKIIDYVGAVTLFFGAAYCWFGAAYGGTPF
jgi:hypothetical protein